jgi:hypothetical protein
MGMGWVEVRVAGMVISSWFKTSWTTFAGNFMAGWGIDLVIVMGTEGGGNGVRRVGFNNFQWM